MRDVRPGDVRLQLVVHNACEVAGARQPLTESEEVWSRYERPLTTAPWDRAGVTLEEWRTTWSRLESLRDALKQEGLARGVPRESIENVLADVDKLLSRVEAGDPAVFATIHALR